MKLMESTLPSMYSKGLFEEKCMDLAPEHMDKMLDILFTGVSNILAATKSKDHPVAFIFSKEDKSFIAAGIVQYFDAEDNNDIGNWSINWTFDEADIPENALRLTLADPQTHSYFVAVAGSKYGILYKTDAALCVCLTYALVQLKKWLDENAKEGSEVELEMDGFFKARVAVENGVKVFALAVEGEVKNIIKDDAAIEK